ncbi:variable large family protein [Borrelia duttonii]|uniref:Variable large protein n=2 Tax=Borrelia duttonii TaxID=40834 RepID=B5RP67_BORDL|nr:vlp protein, delta subfamily [Borrelia duttonii Ly]
MQVKKEEGKIRVIIVMVMMMVMMGCNSGGRDPEKVFLSEMVNLGKGFLDVFVGFGDMITGTLGIKAETKKSDIGKYFTDIAATMESVKNKLQTEVAKNGNYEKVKTVVEQFITGILDKIAEGAKEAAKGATGDDAIGGAPTAGQDAAPADATSVNALVKGIKEIVGVVLKKDEGNPEATKTKDDQQKTIGKLFGGKNNDGTETDAAAASASIGAVSGADILQAIAVSAGASGEPTIQTAKNAAEVAAAKKEDQKTLDEVKVQKDAIIGAGIALRGMSKGGKFAAKAEEKSVHAVNGAVASAVSKVLSTLTIAIRNTVNLGLKEINKVLGEIKQGEGSEVKVN